MGTLSLACIAPPHCEGVLSILAEHGCGVVHHTAASPVAPWPSDTTTGGRGRHSTCHSTRRYSTLQERTGWTAHPTRAARTAPASTPWTIGRCLVNSRLGVRVPASPQTAGQGQQLRQPQNSQRVGDSVNCLSLRPNTQRGRTRKVALTSGSMNSRVISDEYLSFSRETSSWIAASSRITSATPSRTTGSMWLSVVTTQRGSARRLRALRDCTLLLNQTDSSCQIPQTGITWGRPSGHTVATQ